MVRGDLQIFSSRRSERRGQGHSTAWVEWKGQGVWSGKAESSRGRANVAVCGWVGCRRSDDSRGIGLTRFKRKARAQRLDMRFSSLINLI